MKERGETTAVSSDRHPAHTPQGELERRWLCLRMEMEKDALDCLVLYDSGRISSGHIRYVTDVHLDRTPAVLLFYSNGSMCLLSGGGVAPFAETRMPWITKAVIVPSMEALCHTYDNLPRAIQNELATHRCKRVGAVGLGGMPARIATCLREVCGDGAMDASRLFDRVRAVKSAYEIECAYQSAALHEEILLRLGELLKVGISEYEVRNALNQEAYNKGFSNGNINVCFDAKTPHFVPVFFQNRRLVAGDAVISLIQGNACGGMAVEIGRIWCSGEVPSSLERAYSDALAVQNEIVSLMKPGASPEMIFNRGNQMLEALGYEREWRMFAHGEGLDFVERPSIMEGEDMLLEENMILAVHPTAMNLYTGAFSCDNYLIRADGAVRINTTPQKIFCFEG